jgi:hypothetical protein
MSELFLFSRPRFTARVVAKVIGQKLGRKLAYQEADESEDVDGNVDVTDRVHVQVGADYLVVGAWLDETTLRSWPARPNIPYAMRDLIEALRDFPDPLP